MPTLIAGVVAVVVLYSLLQMFRAANPVVLARTIKIVGGASQMLGSLVYDQQSLNLPLAAAIATFSVVVMAICLLLVRRTGALDQL